MTTKKDNKGRSLKSNESQISDGRYRYRYTDRFGNRHTIYAWKLIPTDKTPAGKKEDICLREKIKKINQELDKNIIQSTMTVDELVTNYLSIKVNLSKASISLYTRFWEKHIKGSWFGKMQISQVKKSDILRFYSILFKDRNLSASSIEMCNNLLSPAFQLAVDDELLFKNPCKGCTKEYSRKLFSKTKEPLTLAEQTQFLKFVKSHNIYSKHYTLFALLLGTGLRISEALGLTWDDIDFKNKTISVNHQVIYGKIDGKYQFYATKTKTRKNRIVPIQQSLLQELNLHKQKTFFCSMSSGNVIGGYKNFVFLEVNSRSLYTECQVYRIIKRIIKANNKQAACLEQVLPEHISPHTFRHTFCTRMAENGMDIKVLQAVMGHANITMTMEVYNHVDSNRVQKEFEQLPDVLEA